MSPRELWIAALRSGRYKQGKGRLCKDGKHCVLGVACEVYQEHVGDLVIRDIDGLKHYNGFVSTLPIVVMNYFGLYSSIGSGVAISNLTTLNDYGWDFEKLAKLIEETDRYFVT